jgi:transcriptional regulator with XRE-family HTH domain
MANRRGGQGLQRARLGADIAGMGEPNDRAPAAAGVGERIQELRTGQGLSRGRLAKRTGLRRSTLVAIERGSRAPTPDELGAIAGACGVATDLRTPTTVEFALATGAAAEPVRGEAASDALLREYLEMVVELRSGRSATPDSLRQGDLSELAQALGGTPAEIEARLMQLLGSDAREASQIRAAITPSISETWSATS